MSHIFLIRSSVCGPLSCFHVLPSVNCAAVNIGVEHSFERYVHEYIYISYDKPREHVEMQRHHFANKGMYSQNCGFSSSHVRDGPLEKTLESPLDSKEIKAVKPKGNQP